MSETYTYRLCSQLIEQLHNRFLFGHRQLLEHIMIAFLARGHVLLEGPPGTGKTMTAKLLARCLAKSFRRIQFTSDLLPGDLIGSHLYNPARQSFDFIAGPLFADFVVADEIYRTPPRTQSALLEAMEERQVTVEGESLQLNPDFFVIATQNPLDFEGTYPLPESQLDRFLLKLVINHGGIKEEAAIIANVLSGQLPPPLEALQPLPLDRAQADREINAVHIEQNLLVAIGRLIEKTRSHSSIASGCSVRGGIALAKAARILALLQGRDFVVPDDIKALAIPTLRHRIKLTPDAQIANSSEADVLGEIVEQTEFAA